MEEIESGFYCISFGGDTKVNGSIRGIQGCIKDGAKNLGLETGCYLLSYCRQENNCLRN